MLVSLLAVGINGLIGVTGAYLLRGFYCGLFRAEAPEPTGPRRVCLLLFTLGVSFSAGLEGLSFLPDTLQKLPVLQSLFYADVYRVCQAACALSLGGAAALVLIKNRGYLKKCRVGAPDRLRYLAVTALCVSALAAALPMNYRFFESLFFRPVALPQASVGSGMSKKADYGQENAVTGYYHFKIGDEPRTIEFLDVGADIKNIRINVRSDTPAVAVMISVRDEGNRAYNDYPMWEVFDGAEATQYIRVHPYGRVKDVRVSFVTQPYRTYPDENMLLMDIGFNQTVPYRFSSVRMALLAAVLFVLLCLLPKQGFYEYKLDLTRICQRRVAGIACGLIAVFLLFTPALTYSYLKEVSPHNLQYETFSEELAQGRVAYSYPVDPKFSSLENPYDPSGRLSNTYYFDHAYYNGSYYMYFGVVPELLYFLPYRLVTGGTLPTWVSVSLSSAGMCVGAFLLFHELGKRFRRPRLMTYLMLSAGFSMTCGVLLAAVPSVYIVPIAAANLLSVWGLYFWFSADKRGRGTLWRLCLGSLCIALVFGCRPQAGLIFLLAIPLFWNALTKERSPLSKSSLMDAAALILPFVMVAAGLMWYNAARFGSPFDFGANYNVTVNDMTKRGFQMDRLPLGLFSYFLQPACFSATFPFLQCLMPSAVYQGTNVMEYFTGSVFSMNPLLLAVLLAPVCKKALRERNLWSMLLLLLLMPLVIAAADVEMAGISVRYMCDFLLMLFLAAGLVLFSLQELAVEQGALILKYLLGAAFLYAAFYAFCRLFADDWICTAYRVAAPRVFHLAKHLVGIGF